MEPGLDGLIHISDLEGDSRDFNPREALKKGQSIDVQINSIDIEKKRISLKPAAEAQDEEAFKQYMEPESDTYNPFAGLLNDKKKK